MKRELITNIKERFQLALLISIFFPTFIVTYLTAVKASSDKINSTALDWSILIVIYLISYIVFDGFKKSDMREGVLRWLNAMILVGIGFFVIPIIDFITVARIIVSGPFLIIWGDIAAFFVSIWGLQFVPFVVLIFSIIAVNWKEQK